MAVHAQFGDGFGENHVGAGFYAGLGALDGRLQAFNRQCIGARHNHEIGIHAGIDGGFHAVDHFFKRNNGFVGAVAAAFLRHLVFEMHGGHAGFFHGFDGAGDIECAAPTGVDIDQKRGVDIIGDALCVD